MLSKLPPISLQHFPAVKMLFGVASGIAVYSFIPTLPFFGIAILLLLAGTIFLAGTRATEQHSAHLRVGASRIFSGLLRSSTVIAASLYWCASISIGIFIGKEADQSRIDVSLSEKTRAALPPMSAIVRGEITRILHTDSLTTRLLVQGDIDTKSFPRLSETTVLLVIHAPAPAAMASSATTTLHPSFLRAGMSVYAVASAVLPRCATLPTDADEALYAASLDASFVAHAEVRHVAITAERRTVQSVTDDIAHALEYRIYQLFPSETAPFALALLTGNTSFIGLESKRAYSRAGTIHVLAVSGLHLSLVVSVLLVPLAFVRRGLLRWLLAVLGVSAFVLLTGAAPSALRAGVMAGFLFLTVAAQRKAVLLNVAALAVLLLLVWQPSLLYAVGFQMSAAAVFGIALTLPLFEQGFLRLFGVRMPDFADNFPMRKRLASMFGITCAASVAVAPIAAWYFGTVSLVSLIANLVVVPLSSAAMVYTLLSVVFSTFWGGGAELLAHTAHLLLHWMNAANTAVAAPSFAAYQGRYAVSVAFGWSVGMIYCAYSASWRVAVFRGSVVAAGLVMLLFVAGASRSEYAMEIFPREEVVAVLVAYRQQKFPHHPHTILLLHDRRAQGLGRVRPKADIGLERFIQEYYLRGQDSLTVVTTGVSSMLIASRIGRLWAAARAAGSVADSSVQAPPMRVLAQSLLYKDHRFFAALDSLEALGIHVLSASDAMKRDSLLLLREDTLHSQRITWDVWRGTLKVSNLLGSESTIIPQATVYRSW